MDTILEPRIVFNWKGVQIRGLMEPTNSGVNIEVSQRDVC
jgi:hypothetical protein